VEVVGHNLRLPTHSLDGRGVDLEELLRVYGTIIFLWDIRTELGGPVDPPQVCSEGPAPGPVGTNVVIAGGAAPPLVFLRGGAGRGMILLGLSAPFVCMLEGSPDVSTGSLLVEEGVQVA
jgi:hypothetical protein